MATLCATKCAGAPRRALRGGEAEAAARLGEGAQLEEAVDDEVGVELGGVVGSGDGDCRASGCAGGGGGGGGVIEQHGVGALVAE